MRPPATVGLATSVGAGRPATDGGVQDQAAARVPALAGVMLLALPSTDECPRSCRYWGQSVGPSGVAAVRGPVAGVPAMPGAGDAAMSTPTTVNRHKLPIRRIASPPRTR